jgi:hypothetical protein
MAYSRGAALWTNGDDFSAARQCDLGLWILGLAFHRPAALDKSRRLERANSKTGDGAPRMNITVSALRHEILNDSLTPPQAEKQSGGDRPIGDDLFVDRDGRVSP